MCRFLSGRQTVSYKTVSRKAVLIISNLPFVTESNFKGDHLLINEAYRNCPQLPTISLV